MRVNFAMLLVGASAIVMIGACGERRKPKPVVSFEPVQAPLVTSNTEFDWSQAPDPVEEAEPDERWDYYPGPDPWRFHPQVLGQEQPGDGSLPNFFPGVPGNPLDRLESGIPEKLRRYFPQLAGFAETFMGGMQGQPGRDGHFRPIWSDTPHDALRPMGGFQRIVLGSSTNGLREEIELEQFGPGIYELAITPGNNCSSYALRVIAEINGSQFPIACPSGFRQPCDGALFDIPRDSGVVYRLGPRELGHLPFDPGDVSSSSQLVFIAEKNTGRSPEDSCAGDSIEQAEFQVHFGPSVSVGPAFPGPGGPGHFGGPGGPAPFGGPGFGPGPNGPAPFGGPGLGPDFDPA